MVRICLWSTLSGAVILCLIAVTAAGAEVQFTPQLYQALADSASPDTIPPNTRITLQNWRQYKRFLGGNSGALQRRLFLENRPGSRVHHRSGFNSSFPNAKAVPG